MGAVHRGSGAVARKRRRAKVRATPALLAAGLLLSACGGGGGSPTAVSVPASTPTPTPTPTPGPSAVVVLEVGNFAERVLLADGVCLVEFYSPACSHCRDMEPIVEQLAVDFADRAMVGKVNVQTEVPLVSAWNILGWPTFVIVKNGSEVDRWLGATSRERLAGMLEAALAAP
jgi:thioredoxin 1